MLVVASIGIMFGLDMASPGIMNRKPWKINEPIINTRMFALLFITGLFWAAMVLYLFQIGKNTQGSSQIGQAMALVSLSLMSIFVAPNLRFPKDTAFQHAIFSNSRLVYSHIWVVLGSILLMETRLFPSIFGTTSPSAYQWWLCLIPCVILLVVGEIYKASLRYRERNSPVAV